MGVCVPLFTGTVSVERSIYEHLPAGDAAKSESRWTHTDQIDKDLFVRRLCWIYVAACKTAKGDLYSNGDEL